MISKNPFASSDMEQKSPFYTKELPEIEWPSFKNALADACASAFTFKPLVDITPIDVIPSPFDKPHPEINFDTLYYLSKCHDVTLIDRNGKLELYIDIVPDLIPVNYGKQNQLSALKPINYIKYYSRCLDCDLTSLVMPEVDRLYCKEFKNLPHTITKDIEIIIDGKYVRLTPNMYSQYVKIEPKYLAGNDYLYIKDCFNVLVDYRRYYTINSDKYESEYYCCIVHNKLQVFKGHNPSTFPFIKEAIDKLQDDFESVQYFASKNENLNVALQDLTNILGDERVIKMIFN